jgi:acyl-CoA thioester hydrolase
MRARPFEIEPFSADQRLVVHSATGQVWHRSFQRVAYADTDRANVVYHANYLRYFEVGRTELMRDAGYAYARVEADGFLFPVVGVNVEYLRSLRYDDPAWIYTRPGAAEDGIRFTFEYLICHAERKDVMCIGSTTHCTLGHKGKPIAMEAHAAALWHDFPKLLKAG